MKKPLAIIPLSILTICILIGLLLGGCDANTNTKSGNNSNNSVVNATKFQGNNYRASLITVVHDGHEFVVCDSEIGTSIIHHPSCHNCKN